VKGVNAPDEGWCCPAFFFKDLRCGAGEAIGWGMASCALIISGKKEGSNYQRWGNPGEWMLKTKGVSDALCRPSEDEDETNKLEKDEQEAKKRLKSDE
jgi:hypothetical protein